jgi:hypothetical protein
MVLKLLPDPPPLLHPRVREWLIDHLAGWEANNVAQMEERDLKLHIRNIFLEGQPPCEELADEGLIDDFLREAPYNLAEYDSVLMQPPPGLQYAENDAYSIEVVDLPAFIQHLTVTIVEETISNAVS